MDTSILEAPGRRRRRRHSAEFKAQLIKTCQQPGVSSAVVALANGLNANMLNVVVFDFAESRARHHGSSIPPK
jgi:transposase-like protein